MRVDACRCVSMRVNAGKCWCMSVRVDACSMLVKTGMSTGVRAGISVGVGACRCVSMRVDACRRVSMCIGANVGRCLATFQLCGRSLRMVLPVCVCVCVCERERESERKKEREHRESAY